MYKLNELKQYYEDLYKRYNNTTYITSDPIDLVYRVKGNKEFVAFVSSLFSYGKVENIQKFLSNFFFHYGNDPYNIILDSNDTNLYYRFQRTEDIKILVELIAYIYKNYGSLEKLFLKFSYILEDAFIKFSRFAIDFGKQRGAHKGYFNLFPIGEGLYSKRLNMFLRWMIRKDNIDLGLWRSYKASELKFPMDTHIMKFAITHNIISSRQNNISNVNKITNYFKKFSYNDPVKYDFAITRQAMLLGCTFKSEVECNLCIDNNKCLFC